MLLLVSRFDQNPISAFLAFRATGSISSGRPEPVRDKKNFSGARGKVAPLGHLLPLGLTN